MRIRCFVIEEGGCIYVLHWLCQPCCACLRLVVDFKADYFSLVLKDKINFMISMTPVIELECISQGLNLLFRLQEFNPCGFPLLTYPA